jgi:hypothetical protein
LVLVTELDQLGFMARGGVRSEHQIDAGLNDNEKISQSSDLIHRLSDNTYPNNSYGVPGSPSITPIIQSPTFVPAHNPSGVHSISSHESLGEIHGAPDSGRARASLKLPLINHDSAGLRTSSSHSNAPNKTSPLSRQTQNNNE